MGILSPDSLVRVNGLAAAYRIGNKLLPVVRGVNLELQAAEVVCLLGESGCGKTTMALAILGLLAEGAVVQGSVHFRGMELVGAPEKKLQEIRGAQISFIPQEPLLSLNPVMRAVDQVYGVMRAHQKGGRDGAHAALQRVGLAREFHDAYPHQMSGGQRQRVLIAEAIVCEPALVIADEPTGSLDARAAREILELLHGLVRQSGTSLLLITHDPEVVASTADRARVMYAGRIVEAGEAHEVLSAPRHPYTRGLLRSLLPSPRKSKRGGDRHVAAIDGSPPDFENLPRGCAFEARCPDRMAACAEGEPAAVSLGSRQVSCFLYEQSR